MEERGATLILYSPVISGGLASFQGERRAVPVHRKRFLGLCLCMHHVRVCTILSSLPLYHQDRLSSKTKFSVLSRKSADLVLPENDMTFC